MQFEFHARIQNQAWRLDESTGFLRCTATVLCVGVMAYDPPELPGAPPPQHGPQLLICTTPEALADPGALASLEGVPAVVGHIWQTVGSVEHSCGNTAGAPRLEGEHVVIDVLVTDAETVRRIMLPDNDPAKLSDISGGYDAVIEFAPGVTTSGEPFDGTFTRIRYNHLAIIPPGTGRGGPSVRIINRKGAHMPEFTRVKLNSGAYVRVQNEDLPALEADQKEAAKAPDASKLQDLLDKLAALNPQLEALQKEKETLVGQLQALQEQLQAAMDPGNVETAAQNLAQERDERSEERRVGKECRSRWSPYH
jgi:hypothetical protein